MVCWIQKSLHTGPFLHCKVLLRESESERVSCTAVLYGDQEPDEQRFKVLDKLYELGGRFIDSSDAYGDNEELLGKWFQRSGKRDEVGQNEADALDLEASENSCPFNIPQLTRGLLFEMIPSSSNPATTVFGNSLSFSVRNYQQNVLPKGAMLIPSATVDVHRHQICRENATRGPARVQQRSGLHSVSH